MASRNTWFHIPEKFPLRDRICRKSSFYGTLLVTNLRVTGNVLRRRSSFSPLVDIPQIYHSWVTFAEGCRPTVFQLSTSERLPLPRYQQRRNLDAYIFSNILTYSPGGATIGSPICTGTLLQCTFSSFVVIQFSLAYVGIIVVIIFPGLPVPF